MTKAMYSVVLRVLPVVALIGFISPPTMAFAACNALCETNDALWKTRQPIEINGKSYFAAVAPDRTYVLVAWKKGTKTTSLAEVEMVGSAASGCTAKDSSILSSLSGDPATPIATKVFRKFKYLMLDLTC
jgi:hypothetical protein